MSHLQNHYHLKSHFQKGDQHTGAKVTKHLKDNHLQSLELPYRIS